MPVGHCGAPTHAPPTVPCPGQQHAPIVVGSFPSGQRGPANASCDAIAITSNTAAHLM
jgi:hypothetical protein